MKEKRTRRWLSLLLTVVMVLSLIPATVLSASAADSTFYRIFHLDCGRKYFPVDQIEALIDTLAENKYTHMELAIGNDGLRFLLDDMSVTANDTTYTSDAVKAGIQAGNKAYYNAGTYNELTQTEMDTIISYADEKGIGIIPLLNTPGHMDAILDCMESVGISNPAYSTSGRTVDVTNTAAVNFTLALVNKYIQYFAGKGCKFFNMGCDEYANDVSNSGFAGLISSGKYDNFITYVNNMAAQVKAAGMTPMAFNDGIYYNSNTSFGTFDSDIVIAYWTSGWPGYFPASAAFLAQKGHTIISTNDAWYYVLGRQAGNSSGYTIATAQNGVQNTACTDIPGDNDPTAAGCMICLWCDTPSASYSSTEVSNVTGLLTTFATNNPTYFAAEPGETDPETPTDPQPGEPVEVTEDKTFTVTVGQTATDTIEGADYSNNIVETELDKSIATVSAEYKQVTGGTEEVKATSITSGSSYYIKKSSGQYLSSSATWVSDISSAALWTATSSFTGYTLKNGNNYLRYRKSSLSTTTDSWRATAWTFSNGTFSYESLLSGSTPLGDAYTVTPTAPVNETTVTFTGVAVGTTYVTVGNTRYTINVLAEDLSEVTPLTVEYWITNLPVTAGGATSKAISAQSAYGEAGVDVSTLVPATGTYAYGSVVYWKGTVLDYNNNQTTASGDDETADGKDFRLIRYYNGSWQYFYEAAGTWNTISSTDQVVIYWLQPTEVTKEITTLVKDWGYTPSNQQGDNYNKVALTFAVVYPDGTVSPAEGDMYSTSTILYNYSLSNNALKSIGLVAPVNNSNYDISKITVTNGKRDQSGTGQWGVNDTITWEKVTNEAGEQWYDETTYWDETVGGTPMVNGDISQIGWTNYNTAILVLIYLKPVHYDTNLIVNWVDDSASRALISTMEVAVSSDGTPITFYNGLKQTSALPTEGVGGTFTLDDDAYVTNSSNVNQTFNKNISTVPGVADVYKTGLYQYVSADLSADGKTLTLHYNLDSTKLQHQYVLDFGLPVEIPLSDIAENATAENTEVTGSATYGKAEIVGSNLVYTPEKVLQGTDVVTVNLTGITIRIGFVPASNVLYEDGFMTPDTAGTDAVWSGGGNKGTGKTQTPGTSASDSYVYGFDPAYQFVTGASDSQYIATVTSDKCYTNDLTFTFTGTGFDLIGACGSDTGTILVRVDNSDGYFIGYLVDTAFNDSSVADKIYQVPLLHGQDWPYDTYTVTVMGAYIDYGTSTTMAASFGLDDDDTAVSVAAVDPISQIYALMEAAGLSEDDMDNVEFINMGRLYGAATMAADSNDDAATPRSTPSSMTVEIDGFRVYDEAGTYVGNYAEDEKGVTYVNVLEAVDYNKSMAAYIEANANHTLVSRVDYEGMGGPQNEIYLASDQSIVLNTNLREGVKVQVSARAVNGTAVLNNTTEISSNTEMYYTVTTGNEGVITIANTGSDLLALGNLKLQIAGAASLLFEEVTDDTLQIASVMMLSYYAAEPEEPEGPELPVFTPEKLNVSVKSLNVIRNKLVTVTVNASTDVAKLTINGQTVNPINSLLVKRGWSKEYIYVLADTVKRGESKNYEIIAYNADGTPSTAKTVTG